MGMGERARFALVCSVKLFDTASTPESTGI